MAPLAVKLTSMNRHSLVYWSEIVSLGSVCMGCGQKINYDQDIAFVGVQEPMSANPSPAELEGVERFLLCSDCGTNVERLVELGIKRIVDIEFDDPDSNDEPGNVELLKPATGEKKN